MQAKFPTSYRERETASKSGSGSANVTEGHLGKQFTLSFADLVSRLYTVCSAWNGLFYCMYSSMFAGIRALLNSKDSEKKHEREENKSETSRVRNNLE